MFLRQLARVPDVGQGKDKVAIARPATLSTLQIVSQMIYQYALM
jgi:hypothetical protein